MTFLVILIALVANAMAVPIAHLDASANVDASSNNTTVAPAAPAITTTTEMHIYDSTTAAPPAANSTSSQPATTSGEGSGSGTSPAVAAGETNTGAAANGEGSGSGTSPAAAAVAAGPCKAECTPKIDVNASVVESYKRHRAQAALIGDYGDCAGNIGKNGSSGYTWTVDWGDDESYEHKSDAVGPYQAEHVYHKKGKYTVEVTYCHSLEVADGEDSCDAGCSTFSKKISVKP